MLYLSHKLSTSFWNTFNITSRGGEVPVRSAVPRDEDLLESKARNNKSASGFRKTFEAFTEVRAPLSERFRRTPRTPSPLDSINILLIKRLCSLLSILIIIFSNNLSSNEILEGYTTFFTFDKALLTRDSDLFMVPKGHVRLDHGYSFDVGVSRIENGGLEIGGQFGYRVEKQKLKSKAIINHIDSSGNSIQATIASLNYQNQMMNLLMKVGLDLDVGELTPYIGGFIGVSRIKLFGDVMISLGSSSSGSSAAEEKKIESDAIYKIAYGGEAGLIVPISTEVEVGFLTQYFGLFNINKKDIFNKSKVQDREFPDAMKIKTGEWSIKGMIRFLA